MRNLRLGLSTAAFAGLAALALQVALGHERSKPQPTVPPAVPTTQVPDAGKGWIERPTETAVARQTTPVGGPVVAPAVGANSRVTPGKVRWHATFAAACEAAKRSGKPVLLFQMMGRLDRQFC